MSHFLLSVSGKKSREEGGKFNNLPITVHKKTFSVDRDCGLMLTMAALVETFQASFHWKEEWSRPKFLLPREILTVRHYECERGSCSYSTAHCGAFAVQASHG